MGGSSAYSGVTAIGASELQNARVLLEEASELSRNLAYHCRARLEARIGEALDEVDRQIQELRAYRGYERRGRPARSWNAGRDVRQNGVAMIRHLECL